jgi:hypothetical protein
MNLQHGEAEGEVSGSLIAEGGGGIGLTG